MIVTVTVVVVGGSGISLEPGTLSDGRGVTLEPGRGGSIVVLGVGVVKFPLNSLTVISLGVTIFP